MIQWIGFFITLTLLRFAVGVFFAISGYHKLTNKARHETLRKTLAGDHIPWLPVMQWWVPGVELVGGIAVAIGFLTPIFAAMLAILCLVACLTDGIWRIPGWMPIDKADWLDDLLYLPEALYCLILSMLFFAPLTDTSLDNVLDIHIWGWVNGWFW